MTPEYQKKLEFIISQMDQRIKKLERSQTQLKEEVRTLRAQLQRTARP